MRGYKPGRFSFNVKGGRCEACQGDGIIKIEMHFLPDVYVPCEVCKGKRYNRETLEVQLQGQDHRRRAGHDASTRRWSSSRTCPAIQRKLQTLHDVGLGYIKLGQPATTLSGGEAQRVKLATELSPAQQRPHAVHPGRADDRACTSTTSKAARVLHRLVDAGNTVLVIEHNLDVIKTADWIIDLGPEGGDRGGRSWRRARPSRWRAWSLAHRSLPAPPAGSGSGSANPDEPLLRIAGQTPGGERGEGSMDNFRRMGACATMALILVMLAAAGAFGQQSGAATVTVGSATAQVNGNSVNLEVAASLVAGEPWGSVRPIAEALGARVLWDPAARRVQVEAAGHELVFTVGSDTARIDGTGVPLGAGVVIRNGRAQVPLRVLAQGLGFEAAFDAATGTLAIGGPTGRRRPDAGHRVRPPGPGPDPG